MRALLLIAAPLTLVACTDSDPTADAEDVGYTDETVIEELDTTAPPEPGTEEGAAAVSESEDVGSVEATQPIDSAESGEMPEPM